MLRSFWLMFVLSGDVSKVANNCQPPTTSLYSSSCQQLYAILPFSANTIALLIHVLTQKTCHVTGYLQIRNCDNCQILTHFPYA